MLCCFKGFPRLTLCINKRKQRIVISLVDFNKLIDRQKEILRRDYDIYFSEFLGD